MERSPDEARVLACLIEGEATVPDRYPFTLNELRLACNQTSGRKPVVAYDDRTVETALLSLTSKGLVRATQAPDSPSTIRYRHVADDRWRLDADELAVLAALVLGGAQRAADVRRRLDHTFLGNRPIRVEEILDTLAARSPDPLAGRLGPAGDDGERRWSHRLSGPPAADGVTVSDEAQAAVHDPAAGLGDELKRLDAEVRDLRDRVTQLEKLLGWER